jgi:hypothetical protein
MVIEVTRIGGDGGIRRAVVDTAGREDAARWERPAQQAALQARSPAIWMFTFAQGRYLPIKSPVPSPALGAGYRSPVLPPWAGLPVQDVAHVTGGVWVNDLWS